MAIRFLVRLANKTQLTPKEIDVIAHRANSLLNQFHANVGNIRVSEHAIEMDLFPPNVRDAAALAHRLEEEFSEILTFRQLDLPIPPQLQVKKSSHRHEASSTMNGSGRHMKKSRHSGR